MKLTENHIKLVCTTAKYIVILAVLAFIYSVFNHFTGKSQNEITHQSVIEKVEAIGKLSLVKMTLQDIVEYTKPRRFLPDASAIIVVQGEVEAGINMATMRKQDIHIDGKTIKTVLPQPEIMNFRVNHNASRVYDTKNNWFSGAEIVDEAYAKAESQIKTLALTQGILQTAQENAVKFFTSFFHSLGYENVIIEFAGSPRSAQNPEQNIYKEKY